LTPKQKKSDRKVNPFYVLLVIAGTCFGLTAIAYGVMASAYAKASEDPDAETILAEFEQHPLYRTLDNHGVTIMLIELVMLAIFTVAAIGLDTSRDKRHVAKSDQIKPTDDHIMTEQETQCE
tara:strand:+ start:747 stop:1112 length:366 start_codon:yes stop_codon:yes gene_type:complete